MADDDNNNYNYHPSLAAAIVFAILFGLTMVAHHFLMFKSKHWWLIPLVIATILETEGYVFRYLSAKHFTTLWPLIISQVSIVVAPAFLAANDYMMVGRLMSFVGSENALIRHTLITKIFVFSDVATILTQAGGAGSLSSDNINTVKTARIILIASLIFQTASFFFFLFVAAAFHIKARRNLGSRLDTLMPLLWAFYASAVLIIGRSVYRVIEFASIDFTPGGDQHGYLITHEWPFYLLDSLPILIAVSIFVIWHPGNYLPASKGLRMDGGVDELLAKKRSKPRFWRRNRSTESTEMGTMSA